jgi:hypothetical protein
VRAVEEVGEEEDFVYQSFEGEGVGSTGMVGDPTRSDLMSASVFFGEGGGASC